MKWKYFCGACLVVGAALLKAGAPVLPVITGICLAALLNCLRNRSAFARTRRPAASTLRARARTANP